MRTTQDSSLSSQEQLWRMQSDPRDGLDGEPKGGGGGRPVFQLPDRRNELTQYSG
jgi:hypothetical protein